MEEDKIEDIFRSAFDNHQTEVPERVWTAIQSAITKKHKTSRSTLFLIYTVVSVAACLVIFFAFDRVGLSSFNFSKSRDHTYTKTLRQSSLPNRSFKSDKWPNDKTGQNLKSVATGHSNTFAITCKIKTISNKGMHSASFRQSVKGINTSKDQQEQPELTTLNEIPAQVSTISLNQNEPEALEVNRLSKVQAGETSLIQQTTILPVADALVTPKNRQEDRGIFRALLPLSRLVKRVKKETSHVVSVKTDANGNQEFVLNLGIARLVKPSNRED